MNVFEIIAAIGYVVYFSLIIAFVIAALTAEPERGDFDRGPRETKVYDDQGNYKGTFRED